jgi:hypothetical protein
MSHGKSGIATTNAVRNHYETGFTGIPSSTTTESQEKMVRSILSCEHVVSDFHFSQ